MGYTAGMSQSPDTAEVVLPTFAVLARFRESATSGDAAVLAVQTRLTDADEPFDQVVVERQEGHTTWMIVARFVLVSVDGHTAVLGLDETLRGAVLAPDEVWVDRTLS